MAALQRHPSRVAPHPGLKAPNSSRSERSDLCNAAIDRIPAGIAVSRITRLISDKYCCLNFIRSL